MSEYKGYNKKTSEEKRKYGKVRCSVCHKLGRPDWNIYSANTFCSEECKWKWIHKTLESPEVQKHFK